MLRTLISGFFAYAALSCVIPVIPTYAESLGADALKSAVAAGIFALLPAVAMTPFGFLSELHDRRLFLYAGYFTSTISGLLYLLSNTVELLIVSRLIHGLGSAMFVPALNAIVAEKAEKRKRGEEIGKLQTSLMLGFFAGPIAGGIVSVYGYSASFALSLIFSLLSLLFIAGIENSRKSSERMEFRISANLVPLYILMFVGMAASSALSLFAIPYYSEHLNLSSAEAGGLVSIIFLISALIRIPAGLLADRIGRKAVAVFGMLFIAFSLLVASIADKALLLFASIACGGGNGMVNTAVLAAAADSKNKGAALGIANTALNAGIFAGTSLAGFLAGFMNYADLLTFMAVLVLLFSPASLISKSSREFS